MDRTLKLFVLLKCQCRYAADGPLHPRGGPTCTKYQYKHRRLTPGLFWIYCLECGVCIGFFVMDRAESPRTLFDVLFTRWERPPEVVVYDNSCHGQAFALNRESEWSKSMQWAVDAMHFKGHKGCAHSYDIKRFPLLSDLNSQRCEQQVCSTPRKHCYCFVFVLWYNYLGCLQLWISAFHASSPLVYCGFADELMLLFWTFGNSQLHSLKKYLLAMCMYRTQSLPSSQRHAAS